MERVLSVSAAGTHRLYPLTLLEQRAVTNAQLRDVPYVEFTKPGMASPLNMHDTFDGRPIPAATAFGRRLEGRVLELAWRNGRRVDLETGSE